MSETDGGKAQVIDSLNIVYDVSIIIANQSIYVHTHC